MPCRPTAWPLVFSLKVVLECFRLSLGEVDVPESSGQRVSFSWTAGTGASDCAFQSWHLQIAQNGASWPFEAPKLVQ